jgi:hypothetical protein
MPVRSAVLTLNPVPLSRLGGAIDSEAGVQHSTTAIEAGVSAASFRVYFWHGEPTPDRLDVR